MRRGRTRKGLEKGNKGRRRLNLKNMELARPLFPAIKTCSLQRSLPLLTKTLITRGLLIGNANRLLVVTKNNICTSSLLYRRFHTNSKTSSIHMDSWRNDRERVETTKKITASMLAHEEQIANKKIHDSQTQHDFYKLLLKSNYPQYVVARFETPGIATSPECTELYMEALQRIGRHPEADYVRLKLLNSSSVGLVNPTLTENTSPNNTTSTNNSMAVSNMAASSLLYGNNHGTKQTPLHVIISESKFTIISRWIKWIAILGIVSYGLTGVLNYVVDNSSLINNTDASKIIDSTDVENNVTFNDVKGCDEARFELEEIVDFLKNPDKYKHLGGVMTKGVLLTGPPGTGKTLLAKATASESNVKFFTMSGSEFDEVYVGVGAKRIRELFNQARQNSPAIIFIDEIDAIGGKRSGKDDQGFARQTLNQLLVELDGFKKDEGIIIIGATNFPESLDKALLRPGRFDKIVNIDLPDVRGRTEILKHHMGKITLGDDVDCTLIARGTPGLSGAELFNLVNQAAVYACQQNASEVNMLHLEWAKDKILMGAERKSMVMTEATKKATAFHEAGHAIMAKYTAAASPLYKATILPRGNALGITFQLPEMDKVDITRKECLARLDVCMGGKIAEELIFGEDNVTSGCGSDLRTATNMARAMITEYGMNDEVGPINLAENWNTWSNDIQERADNEVIKVLKEAETRCRQLLKRKNVELHRLAQGLVEYETLDAKEMDRICLGKQIDRDGSKNATDEPAENDIHNPDLDSHNNSTISPVLSMFNTLFGT
ncbi:ATP-dependent metallopeptidase FtsH/Yme1/Tma family protein NDAI_0E03960 [Naumovozyma dairenensis CBS 421]|uniref:AAA+ ATPase domain-containing protein n=1 Tax=Naumovozyma dairenensis (strain ATCC 10597 / BCRC 20456 / CBS 421 / NBRC 0211 / NRRL Y-12639) TaxID=1071378 RepID=G0WBU3_NAUDC|nr:hypothetical protein NDAI_0E03960 [Naumovozyma dairenensis CBS 421]CCD25213.1 hypothetical protein NDAI_0E03960 [Naumovozyma dairenensis CBS 421]